MRKWLIVGTVLLFLCVVVVLVLLNLNFLIERNRDFLVAQAEQALGRKVSVGKVGVSLLNGIGVRLKDFSISDDTSFSKGEFIRARDLKINLEFWPLLSKEIQIKRMILNQPVIGIIRDKKGAFNFSSIGKKEKGKKPAARKPPAEEAPPLALLVNFIDISDGELRYQDRKEGVDFRVQKIDLRVEDLEFDKPFSLNLSAALLSKRQNLKIQTRVGPLRPDADLSEVPLSGTIELDSLDLAQLKSAVPKIIASLPKELDLTGTLKIKEMKLSGTLKKLTFQGAVDGTDAAIQFGKDFKKSSGTPLVVSTEAQYSGDTLSLRRANVKLHTLELTGKGNLRLGKTLSLDLSLDSNRFSLSGWEKIVPLIEPYGLSGDAKFHTRVDGTLGKLTIKGAIEGTDAAINFGKTFQKVSGTPLVISTEAQVAGDRFSFHQAKLKLHTLELSGKGQVLLGKLPSLDLSLDSNRFSLSGWEKIVPLIEPYRLSGDAKFHTRVRGRFAQKQKPTIQGNVTLSGVSVRFPQLPNAVKDLNATVNFTPQTADIQEASLNLGSSQFQLAAQVKRFAPLVLSYKLSSPQFRASDVLTSPPEGLRGDTVKGLNSEGLVSIKNGDLSYQGKVTSAEGTLYNIGYKNLGAGLVLNNKVAKIRDFRIETLKGSVQAQGIYSMSQQAPSFSLDTTIKGLDLKELYASVDPKAPKDIQGFLNADLKIAGTGNGWEQIKPNLSGEGQAEVLKGALLNFNLAEGVLSGITGIGGLTSLINPQVREKYPETFESKDTEFKELKGLFNLDKGQMDVKSLVITAADYTVQGKGRVDFNRRVNFNSMLVFSQRLSNDMARSAKEVRYLFNDRGLFEVPFRLAGTLPNVKPRPDSKYVNQLIKRGLSRKGAEEIRRRIFGEKKEPTPPVGSQPTPKKPDPLEDLIRRGLEGIFGR